MRLGVFLGVLLAHVAVPWLLQGHELYKSEAESTVTSAISMVLVADGRPELRRGELDYSPAIRFSPPELQVPLAPVMADEERTADTPPPRSIDWSDEARQSITARIAAAAEHERQSAAFDQEGVIVEGRKPRSREFGWSRARINRIEQLPQGGILINLSERCVLVIAPLLLPACRFGKIEARGDLFDGMNAEAAAGDWKDGE